MKRPSHLLVSGGLALVLAWACGGGSSDDSSPACTVGSERCACYANKTCDGALRCLSNVCVARPGQGSSGEGGSGAAGGEGDADAGEAEPGAGGSPLSGSSGSPNSSGGAPTGGSTAGGTATGGSAGQGDTSAGDGGTAPSGTGGANGAGETGDGGSFELGGTTGGGGTPATGGSEPTGGVAPSTGGSADGGSAGETGPSGEVLFSDDFDDGDAAGWDADSWLVYGDGNNDVLRQNPNHMEATTSALAGSSNWTARRMEVSFKFVADTSYSSAVMGSHFETSNDRDQLMIDRSGSGTLLHARGGVITSDTFDATIEGGTWYRFTLEITGTTLRGYLDGALVAVLENVTDVRGGIALSANQSGDVYYDDVLVTSL